MTLEEFEKEMKENLTIFCEYWVFQSNYGKDKEDFPTEMSQEEWEEQFLTHLGASKDC